MLRKLRIVVIEIGLGIWTGTRVSAEEDIDHRHRCLERRNHRVGKDDVVNVEHGMRTYTIEVTDDDRRIDVGNASCLVRYDFDSCFANRPWRLQYRCFNPVRTHLACKMIRCVIGDQHFLDAKSLKILPEEYCVVVIRMNV